MSIVVLAFLGFLAILEFRRGAASMALNMFYTNPIIAPFFENATSVESILF